ncbi:extracellular solute-binding protein [Paenibacillus oryzisoli]|uniref:extracellular solute-binding protein n=1 Tax=Paenibacillus oryzisoli TaxID=1850517 RepID=UPI003D299301
MLKKKNIAYASVVSLLFTGVLSACSGDKAEPGGQNAAGGETASPTAAAYTLPIVKDGSVTLKVAVPDNGYAPKSYTQNLPVWQEFEKKTGVKINWDVTASAQYNQAMNIRLAAASDLPDILKLPANPVTHADDGLIIPLNDLIDKYAPNIKKYFETYPQIRKLLTAPDGKIYALTNDVSGSGVADPQGWLIRKDWLDKLGLKEPTTLDEWYTVLKAFKEKDPNGNGKADEIPLAPNYSWGGLSNFGKALGLHLGDYSDDYSVDANGKVKYDWLDPKAGELVTWLAKLYKEGLIHPEFVTKKTPAQVLPDISLDKVGATQGFVNATAKFEAAVNKPGVDWIMTVPPANAGVKGWYEKYGPISGYYGITKDAKNPEVAIKWLDYIFASEEGARMQSYGVEGISYTMVNGKPQFTDFVKKNPDGLDPTSALRSLGAFPTTPWIRDDKGVYSDQAKDLTKMTPALEEQAKKIEPYLKDGIPFQYMLSTDKEAAEIKRISTDLDTFHEETVLKNITGKEPVNWDAYVKRSKELGVDRLIEIRQAQYDRFIKN